MRVLVLGATGFLGSWTVRALLADGHSPIALLRSESDDWRLSPLCDGVEIRRAALADWPAVVRAAAADVVISLDWTGLAAAERDDATQWRNVDRLASTVRSAIDGGARRVVGIGSQAEYGPHDGLVAAASTMPAPATEYGRAKLEAGRMLLAAAASAGIDGVWGRVFSTYGPLDQPHWLLPKLAARLLRGERAELTAGTQRWSYLTGADAGRAIALLATAGSGAYDIGSASAPPLRETIETFAAHFGGGELLDFGAIEQGADPVRHLQTDVGPLQELGWQERIPLSDGLAQTADWLKGRPVVDSLLAGRVLPRPR